MKICSKCRVPVESDICPVCSRRKFVVEAAADDLVLLTTTDYVSSFLIEEFLNESGIKFLKKGELGSGLTVYLGELSERFNFFVFAKNYDEAIELIPNLELTEEFDEN